MPQPIYAASSCFHTWHRSGCWRHSTQSPTPWASTPQPHVDPSKTSPLHSALPSLSQIPPLYSVVPTAMAGGCHWVPEPKELSNFTLEIKFESFAQQISLSYSVVHALVYHEGNICTPDRDRAAGHLTPMGRGRQTALPTCVCHRGLCSG